ncbi:MAG TPA: hypothetical protein DCM57_01055 [Treponema sp.]|nr:hypothetical protein [Treponema sp.]
MRNLPMKLLFSVLLIVLSAAKSFSQSGDAPNYGIDLCENLYSKLTERGIPVEKQELIPSDSESFPQNLLITVSAENAQNQSEKWYDSSINMIIFAFTQEFAGKNLESLISFVSFLSESNLSYTAVVFLSANDSFPLTVDFENNVFHPTGTKAWVSSLGYDDRICAIVIDSGAERAVIPGTNGTVAPLWLVRTICNSFTSNGENPQLSYTFPLLYQLGFTKKDTRMEAFFEQNIPVAGLTLKTDYLDNLILRDIAKSIDPLVKENWDRHYAFFKVGRHTYWIGEAVSIVFFFLFSIFILLAITFKALSRSDRNVGAARDILHTWYFIPFTLFLTTVVLHLTQGLFSSLATENPLLLVSLKMLFAVLAVFIVFILRISLNFRVSFKASGYHMLLMSALNVFIFSYLNIWLEYIMFFEYILIFIAEKTKRTPTLIIMFIVPFIPFVLLISQIVKHTNPDALSAYIVFPLYKNLLLSCLLFPVLMQLERVLIALDLFSPEKKMNPLRYMAYSAASIAVLALSLALIYQVCVRMLPKTETEKPSFSFAIKERPEDEYTVKAELQSNNFMELNMHELTVESGAPAIRYTISVESKSGVPVYESNYEYTMVSPNKIVFITPDYPAGPIHIVYSSENEGKVTVEAYLSSSEDRGTLYHERITLEQVHTASEEE